MVSLYDRLGGHVLKWSNLKGQQWGGATLPLQHDGEFFNIEIKVYKVFHGACFPSQLSFLDYFHHFMKPSKKIFILVCVSIVSIFPCLSGFLYAGKYLSNYSFVYS